MQRFNRIIYCGVALAAALFVLDVTSEQGGTSPVMANRVPLTAIDWPRLTPETMPPERWYAQDVAPSVRIRDAFAQFMPGEGKRRYSALDYATP